MKDPLNCLPHALARAATQHVAHAARWQALALHKRAEASVAFADGCLDILRVHNLRKHRDFQIRGTYVGDVATFVDHIQSKIPLLWKLARLCLTSVRTFAPQTEAKFVFKGFFCA